MAEIGGAVVVETPKSQVLAPFFDAVVSSLAIGGFVIACGAVFVYFQARRAAEELVETKAVVSQSHQELLRTKNQFQQIIDAMVDGFVLFDENDRLVFHNAKFEDICRSHGMDTVRPGISFEDLLQAGLRNGSFPEAEGREEEWLREKADLHRNPQGPIEQKVLDGRWIRIVERKTPDGGIVGFQTDITELKEKENELLVSQQRFKDFADTASDWEWESDADHRFVFLSTGLEEGGIYQQSDAVGKTRHEVTDEDSSTTKWKQHYRDLSEHRAFKNFEYTLTGPDGVQKFLSASGKPVFDEDGVFVGYRGTGRDVTVLRKQQEELSAAELRFRLAFEAITVGIILTDVRGKILRVNPETCKIFGYTERQLLGSDLKMLMPQSDASRHDDYIKSYLKTGLGRIIGVGREVVGVRKGGEAFPFNLGIAEMEVEGERQFLGSIVDVSNEKKLANQLRQAQKMESVGQLVGGIAHDFNNILGIVIGNLDLVKRKLDKDEKLYLQVDKAVSAANRAAALTRRLLNFSRQAPTRATPINVNESIRNIYELLQRSITNSIEIKLFLDDDLPNAVADPGDFQDALVNLTVNAKDAMPGGGTLRIGTRVLDVGPGSQKELRQLRFGRYVEVDVADTGSGMSEEVRSRIFDPFFTTKGTGKGTGLGLPMVYGFARRSGGTVTVYTEEGFGTSFKIFLPVSTDREELDVAPVDSENGEDLPHGTETVLVVDDEEELADVASAVLQELGYRTIVVNSGAKAMEVLVSEEPIDLMLSDVVMPGGVSGYELADAAGHLRPAMPVCLVSGFTGDLANGAINPSESYTFLQKPYDNRTLAIQVRSLLDAAQPVPA
ncbi:PAS domain S-box protein [Hwanghaeella grinnelliae]|uniref:PAS domain S-box protein n=1 Tax=Hwanghaeella grinnelliae TaxID=2500179 RepID=UPI00138756FA|nr:PAS domain S-box protein [Hwanghaeella grinnelliae]